MATGWGRNTWSSGPWGEGDVVSLVTGSVAIAGIAPSVVQGKVITPGVKDLVLAGVAPTVLDGAVITPSVGALTLAGIAPAVTESTSSVVSTTSDEALSCLERTRNRLRCDTGE